MVTLKKPKILRLKNKKTGKVTERKKKTPVKSGAPKMKEYRRLAKSKAKKKTTT